jgi:hypothetical protein
MHAKPHDYRFTYVGTLALGLGLGLSACHRAQASPPPSHATPFGGVHLFIALDVSGSMGADHRFTVAVQAARAQIRALPVGQNLSLQIVVASDQVSTVGTFVLRSETDREAALRALDSLQPIASTRTSFQSIDRGLREVMTRDLGAEEQPALVFLTDAISDTPRQDLHAADLGRRIVSIGRGVFAVTRGPVPVEASLSLPLRTRVRSSNAASGRLPPTSGGTADTRTIIESPPPGIELPPSLAVTPRVSFLGPLLGERPSFEFDVTVSNAGLVRRAYALDAEAPDGLRLRFDPPMVVVPPGGSSVIHATATLERTDVPMSPLLHIIARGPGDSTSRATIQPRLESPSWIAQHLGAALLGGLALAALAGLACWWLRRPVRVGYPGREAQSAEVSFGAKVSLSLFAPELAPDAGYLERTGLGGFRVRAGTQTLVVGGQHATPGQRVPYRLGGPILVGETSFVIDRLSSRPNAFQHTPSADSFGVSDPLGDLD